MSETQLTVIVPSLAPGTHPVVVTTAGGASQPMDFLVVLPAPILEAINPTHAPSGEVIALTGQHFGDAPVVTVGGVPAEIV